MLSPRNLAAVAALTLFGCRQGKGEPPSSSGEGLSVDADADGFVATEDCDDADPAVYPGAPEVCDGVDNDCDGDTDDADDDLDVTTATEFWLDADADGYGDPAAVVAACAVPDGAADNALDCDDADPAVSPAADEVCDGADNDCDALVDDDDDSLDPDSTDGVLYWPDADADTWGDDAADPRAYCEVPTDVSGTPGDCDDADPAVNPAAEEIADGIDNDCDASTTEDGLATSYDADGNPTDVTATLGDGTAEAPAVVTLTEPATINLGAGTWYVQLTAQADAVIQGTTGDPSDVVVDAGGSGPALDVDDPEADVTVTDVTLQNGGGNETLYGDGLFAGGNILCSGGAATANSRLTLERVVVQGGDADYGGGIALFGCALTTTDTVLRDNSATQAGAVMVHGSTWTDIDGLVTSNTATNDFGQVWVFEGDATLDGSQWTDGLSADNVGAVAIYDGSLTCIGGAGVLAGIYGNEEGAGEYGAIYVRNDATFDADLCDLGVAADGTDNTPNDVVVGDAFAVFNYGDDASISCDGVSCAEVFR